jgi:hypothetical protein
MTEIRKIARKINKNKFSVLFDYMQKTALRYVTSFGKFIYLKM